MIQANELRIGNIVHATVAGGVHEPLAERIITCGADIDNSFWWHPIPLTKDILLRCGAVQDKSKSWYYYLQNPDGGEEFEVYSGGELGLFFSADCGERFNGLKYLHELQNFWKLITGEELTVK